MRFLSRLMTVFILFFIGTGNQIPSAVEAERVDLPVSYKKGEKIR